MPPHDSPTSQSDLPRDMEMSAPAAEPSIVAARRPGARLRLPGFALLATVGLATAYWTGPVVGTAMGPAILATLLLGALALRIRPERAFVLAALTGTAVLMQWGSLRYVVLHLMLVGGAYLLRNRPRVLAAFIGAGRAGPAQGTVPAVLPLELSARLAEPVPAGARAAADRLLVAVAAAGQGVGGQLRRLDGAVPVPQPPHEPDGLRAGGRLAAPHRQRPGGGEHHVPAVGEGRRPAAAGLAGAPGSADGSERRASCWRARCPGCGCRCCTAISTWP